MPVQDLCESTVIAAEETRVRKLIAPETTLGPYTILSKIGEGGMGEVYRARDRNLRRDVAIKILPPALSFDADRLDRFGQEARAVGKLNHPNILVLHHIGTHAGAPYMVSELLEGETLRKRMNGRALTQRKAMDYGLQLAKGLAAAHEKGIVHRDIKPENIFITDDGRVKILDFGLAKLVPHKETPQSTTEVLGQVHTDPGTLMGTIAYMSPEQVKGEPVGHRSDIFSFGAVLYEMLSGRLAFRGNSAGETMSAILREDPPDLSVMNKNVSPTLECLVRHCLEKNPAERFHSTRDLAFAIESISGISSPSGAGIALPPAPANRPLWPKLLGLAALAGLLVSISLFAVVVVSRSPRVNDNSRLLGVTQVTTWPGLDVHPAISPDGNSIAYSSDHNGSFEIYVRPIAGDGRENQITNDGQANFEPAWSPDGQRIAYCSKNRGGIWIVPSSGGNARQISQFGSHAAWSPDGTVIAFQSDPITAVSAQSAPSQPPSTIWLVPASGDAEPAQITQVGHPAGGHGAPTWSPDGQHIVICVSDFGSTSIWIVSRDGRVVTEAVKYGFDPVYGPDGKSLYYTTPAGLWKTRISPATSVPVGAPLQLASSSSERIRYFTISADGKRIAYSALLTNSNLWYVPLSATTSAPVGPPVSLTQDRAFRNSVPIFSSDGKKIAFNTQKANRDRGEGDLWVMDANGKDATQITTEGGNFTSWFPGQEQLAFLSYRDPHKVWIANLKTGQNKPMSLDFGEEVNYMRLSPDGKQVVFNSKRSGTTNVWKLPIEGGEPKQLTFDHEMIGFACWSPDGKMLGLQLKRSGDTHIAVMPSDGGPITQLTFEPGQSWLSGFSPDGDKLVFAGFRDGSWNIWWVSRSTKEQKKLTDYTKANAFVRYPSWSPLGTQIAYEYNETTGNIWVAEIK